jgi:hypothetical protein
MAETFVLINGAWHGGWAWRPVAHHLRTAGHRVLTPTLPGLADGDDPTKHSLADVVVDLFNAMAAASGNNSVTLPFEVFAGGFIQDATPEVQKLVYDLLVPQPLQYFSQTVKPIDPAKLGVPVSYVLSVDDVALPPGEYGWNLRFPERLGVTAIDGPGSHEACFTRPAELAASFLAA